MDLDTVCKIKSDPIDPFSCVNLNTEIIGTRIYARPLATGRVRPYTYSPKDDLYALGETIRVTLKEISKENKADIEAKGEAIKLIHTGGRNKKKTRKNRIKRRSTRRRRMGPAFSMSK